MERSRLHPGQFLHCQDALRSQYLTSTIERRLSLLVLLTRYQHGDAVLLAIDVALALHRSMNHVVEVLSRLVIRRNNERRVRVF